MDPFSSIFAGPIGSQMASYMGSGGPYQNAMNQMWQVNQANQNADMYLAGLQQQMDMQNAQLAAAKQMQQNQLNQSQQNQALGTLGQLANTRQLGGIFNNIFGGLGNAMGGLMSGFGNMFGGGGGAGGGPINMQSSSGAGISFGGGGGGGGTSQASAGGAGMAAGSTSPYDTAWGQATYGPLYQGNTTTPLLNGRNMTMSNAYGGGLHTPAPFGSPASSMRAAFPLNQGGHPMDPTSVLIRQLTGGV